MTVVLRMGQVWLHDPHRALGTVQIADGGAAQSLVRGIGGARVLQRGTRWAGQACLAGWMANGWAAIYIVVVGARLRRSRARARGGGGIGTPYATRA